MEDELFRQLKMLHKEEDADHQQYLELAEHAEKEEWFEIAGILRDIAHDERTHMIAIEHILEMED